MKNNKNNFITVRRKISIVRALKIKISTLLGFLTLIIFKFTFKKKSGKPEGILLFSFWGLGDSVQQTPLFLGLREKYKNEKIDVLSSYRSFDYLKFLNTFDNIYKENIPWSKKIEFEKYNFFSREYYDFIKFVLKLRKKNYKIAISTRADARDNLFLTLINPEKIICNPKYFGKYISSSKVLYQKNRNKLIFIEELSKNLGLNYRYNLKKTKDKKTNLISVFIDSNDPSRVLDLDLILKSILAIKQSSNFEITIITQEIDNQKRLIVDKYKNVKLTKTNTILELINLISESTFYIGTDSGPSHLAGILNVKNLIIFTSGIPQEDAPYKNCTAIFLDNFSCRPCAGRCIYKNNFCNNGYSKVNLSGIIEKFIFEDLNKPVPVNFIPISKPIN